MQVQAITITNCKSYRLREEVKLDDRVITLVGPNGGGKSSLLDILIVALRRFFLPAYQIAEGEDQMARWREIQRVDPFSDIRRFLDPNVDTEREEVVLQLTLLVGKSDLENIETISRHKADLQSVLDRFRSNPYGNLAFVDSWAACPLREKQSLTYEIRNGNLTGDRDDAHRVFRAYLHSLYFFLLLAAETSGIELKPALLYFSPYRSAALQDLRANLSAERFVNALTAYFNTTSQTPTSLLKLASLFFAEKHRQIEVESADGGYRQRWDGDQDVKQVDEYLKKLGFSWGLSLLDRNRNIYELTVQRGARGLAISKASSGEKEILNFFLGTFALRTRGGLILIDEPELHLHPRWQASLRDLLEDLANNTDNQVVLCTHSPVFITPQTIPHVRRVAKDAQGTSRVIAPTGERQQLRELLHIVNSHNNERLFFAGRVVLVEGIQDRLVLSALIGELAKAAGINEVTEVVEVFGKLNIEKYRRFLGSLQVPVSAIADLDYVLNLKRDDVEGLIEPDWKALDQQVLLHKKSRDRVLLSAALDAAIASGDLEQLKALWPRLKNRRTVLRSDLSPEEGAKLDGIIAQLRDQQVFLLPRGEIEQYLPEGHRDLDGTIELLKPDRFREWLQQGIDSKELKELESICLSALGVDPGLTGEVRLRMRRHLADGPPREDRVAGVS